MFRPLRIPLVMLPLNRVRHIMPLIAPAILRIRAPALLAVLALGGCTALPSIDGRVPSVALSPEQAQATTLGRSIKSRIEAHPGRSGVLPLQDPRVAFAARMQLARAAERTLDVQYYIWQNDITGTMLLGELERAALRGVRVRLLLDDNGIRGLDSTLAALDALPNFQVRLFNPFAYRSFKWANYVTDFSRLNHRMHNKSFTADNQVTIIGGRNIGDIYFGAAADTLFADLDVMAVGPVVPKVSAEFDRYWASSLAYPIGRLVRAPSEGTLARFDARDAGLAHDPAASAYRQALVQDRVVQRLFDKAELLTWAPTQVLSDPPGKALGQGDDGSGVREALLRIFAEGQHSLDLVSPYLVPRVVGTQALVTMARRGVQVRILTNSLGANDAAVVHSGYRKRRKQLLRAGIKLYELPHTAVRSGKHERVGAFSSSSSSSSLHAKTFAVDGQHLFIGSFNFDPRSANLNTEMGFLIESPALAQAMHTAFEHEIPRRAYQVRLDSDGDLYWLRWEDGTIRRYNTEPDTSWLRRLGVRMLSWLPIDWLL